MENLNDETIEKIANAVRNKRISDVWKDPKKAQNWGEGGWMIALLAIIISGATIAMMYTTPNYTQSEDEIDFRNTVLANMDCKTLKQTLLDLESGGDEKSNWDVEKQIIGRCL